MYEAMLVINEAYEDIVDNDDINFEVTEGTNTNVNIIVYSYKKSAELHGKYRRFFQAKKYADAKDCASQLLNVYSTAIKNIEESDINEDPRAFAKYKSLVSKMLSHMIASLGKGFTGKVTRGTENKALDVNKMIIKLKDVNNKLRTTQPDFLKSTIIGALKVLVSTSKTLIDNASCMEKTISNYNSAQKEEVAESVKEMSETVKKNMIKALYESCSNGEISVAEREELLKEIMINTELEGIKVENSLKGESVNDIKEKYNALRKAIYEKCSNNEYTEEVREELLKNAQEMFETEMSNAGGNDAQSQKNIEQEAKKLDVSKDIEKSTGKLVNDLNNSQSSNSKI
jgi:hypothetical protein